MFQAKFSKTLTHLGWLWQLSTADIVRVDEAMQVNVSLPDKMAEFIFETSKFCKMMSPLVIWTKIAFLPKFLKNFIFTRVVRYANPYSSTIPFKVELYEKGLCILEVKEKRAIRNPFSSIHAAALVLLGETAGGL